LTTETSVPDASGAEADALVEATAETSVDAKGDGFDGALYCPSLPGIMTVDAGNSASNPDAGGDADAWQDASQPANGFPIFTAPPATLAETGLYCDIATKTIAPGVKEFQPQFVLWSDGAEKIRWISLPPGTQIDTSNPDHWSFPVGTRFWKEFRYNGKPVETRLISRYGSGANDFLYAAYQWSADGKTATLVPVGGATDVAPLGPGAEGPMHDIPSQVECGTCHGKLSERILGFSAIQVSHSLSGENMTSLIRDHLLTAPPEAGSYTVPGNQVERPALGSLHANCGNCHNDSPTGATPGYFRMRLLVGNTTVESTDTYKTAVNIPHTWGTGPKDAGIGRYRVEGHNPAASELIFRDSTRIIGQQMPPIGTKINDPNGLAILGAWINQLPLPPDAGADSGLDSGLDAGSDATSDASVE
jgi:hypothetical protein